MAVFIPDVKILDLPKLVDDRGWFSETYSRRMLKEGGIDIDFVQDNHVLSTIKGTVRGMHFQMPPFGQDKLLRVVRGAIFDVAVDVRFRSPTFGQHVSTVISATDWNQILVPLGFAHGYVTLEPDTEVIYKVSNHYSPEHEAGFIWNDPALGIEWPICENEVILSDRDRALPFFADLPAYFHHAPTESTE